MFRKGLFLLSSADEGENGPLGSDSDSGHPAHGYSTEGVSAVQPFDFGGIAVPVSAHARIQTGTLKHVQTVLDNYDPAWYADRKRIILEFEWRKPMGRSMVTNVTPDDKVRYGPNPMSRAKPQNLQPVPFVVRDAVPACKEISLYLYPVQGALQLVRAHFGRPYPPEPFHGSADTWPGHKAGLLDLAPGPDGCLDFWRTHAYITNKPDEFDQFDTVEPDWLN